MKKRILTMLLAGVLSVSLLAGCGGSKEPAANTEGDYGAGGRKVHRQIQERSI